MHPTRRQCERVSACRCKRAPTHACSEVHVAVCLKYMSNWSGFGHNAGVNEPQEVALEVQQGM